MVSTEKKEGWTPPVKPPMSLKFFQLEQVEKEDVKWLWYPYIPAGKLTLLEGDPGQGKSWITCSLAADISVGRPLPGQSTGGPPQNVLMLSAEDGLGDTVRPRIEAMNGDLSRIFVSDAFFVLDKEGIGAMVDTMKKTAATIVFLDPIVAYLGGKLDMHRANEVRQIMAALGEAARETGSAIVAVRHLRKAQGAKAIYQGIGSIDFTAAARSVLQVMETKGGTKYMFHAKHNLTPKGESVAYKLEGDKFIWEGILDDTADENKPVNKKSKAIATAERFLLDTLKDGPVAASELHERASLAGVSIQSIQRAKAGIAYSKKTSDGWAWYLEGQEGHVAPAPEQLPAEILAEARARLARSQGV